MKKLIGIIVVNLVILVSATAGYGESYWAKGYFDSLNSEGYDIQQTADLGYIVAAKHPDVWRIDSYRVTKLTDTGEITWDKVYSMGGRGDQISEIYQTDDDGDGEKDDGFIVVGYTGISATNSNAWIIKLSSNGDIMWQKMYGGSQIDHAYSVEQTTDGEYIVAGRVSSGVPGGHPWVIKLDGSGNIQWEKAYAVSISGHAYSIQQTLDHEGNPTGYIVGGEAFSGSSVSARDFLIFRLDNDGELLWQKIYGGSDWDEVNSVKQVFDQAGNPNGYIAAGYTKSFGEGISKNCVLKLDESGQLSWQKMYGTHGTEDPGKLQTTSDGGFIVGGWSNGMQEDTHLFTLKLGGDGSIHWLKSFYLTSWARSIQQTFDQNGVSNGYVAVGDTFNSRGLFVLRIDNDGNIPTILNCPNLSPTNFVESDITLVEQSFEAIVTATNAVVTSTTINPQDVVVDEIITYCCYNDDDYECDGVSNAQDNCPEAPNGPDLGACTLGNTYKIARPCIEDAYCGTDGFCSMDQEDTDEDGIGDACDFCESDFECDLDVDGLDASTFKEDFGRSAFLNPCVDDALCHGDFDCDHDVDGTDASRFKEDFGRSEYHPNPCPPCEVGIWCVYE